MGGRDHAHNALRRAGSHARADGIMRVHANGITDGIACVRINRARGVIDLEGDSVPHRCSCLMFVSKILIFLLKNE